MKKLTALMLAVMLVMSCISVFAETAFVPAETYDAGERAFFGGEITLEPFAADGGQVATGVYSGVPGMDYTDEKVYTYAVSGEVSTMTDWNPHTWESGFDIQGLVAGNFYEFVPNETRDGYIITCEMAAELPVDVTAEYVGRFGVQEGESAKAFRIALNPNACWENGDPITADSYIYSMQQLLNPKMLNRRADTFYSGSISICNARAYVLSANAGETDIARIEVPVGDALASGSDLYVDMWNSWGLEGALDAEGNPCPQFVSINDETLYRDLNIADETAAEAWMSGKYLFDTYLAPGAPFEAVAGEYVYAAYVIEGAEWEDVGIVKVDDYTIDIICDKPVANASFYVPYQLTNWLVHEPTYEAAKTFYDAEGNIVATEEEAATVTTTYCRTLDTTISYGPYKLVSYELDKEYVLERNENWYGYHDGKHLGMYQTDIYKVTVIADHATEMMAFRSGQIASVRLEGDDMVQYATSEYTTYLPTSFTTKVTFNTDYEKLLAQGNNAQLLVVDEFRQGFALSIDRSHFSYSYTAAGTPAYGILNNLYVYDPFIGANYRESEAGKQVVCDIYGITYGEGADYETLDDAYAAVTGYDVEAARAAFNTAADKAVSAGIWDGVSPVVIEFRVLEDEETYVNMINYFNACIAEATVGTPFEGLVTVNMVVDYDYYGAMASGITGCIFSTWGGSDYSPFDAFAMCYCDSAHGAGNQYEYGFDTSAVTIDFVVDGEVISASMQEWAFWGVGEYIPAITDKIGNFGDYSYETRCRFMSAVEKGLMMYYTTTPVFDRNDARMYSMQINLPYYDYISNVDPYDAAFVTFNYDDAEWAAFTAENELPY